MEEQPGFAVTRTGATLHLAYTQQSAQTCCGREIVDVVSPRVVAADMLCHRCFHPEEIESMLRDLDR